ncbi:MAG: hypothetical protein JSR68_07305 [Proteobacteria bacterium]|nr:hypothetical protein [Pseudomonadota bacterium]
MTKFHSVAAVAAVAAAALFAGSAWAHPMHPAAGQAPLFNGAPTATHALQRASVQAEAVRQPPAAGEMNAHAQPVMSDGLLRADVRAATRQALEHGFRIAVGNRS